MEDGASCSSCPNHTLCYHGWSFEPGDGLLWKGQFGALFNRIFRCNLLVSKSSAGMQLQSIALQCSVCGEMPVLCGIWAQEVTLGMRMGVQLGGGAPLSSVTC